jgi:hypothetical protein
MMKKLLLALSCVAALPASAGVEILVDQPTLQKILSAVVQGEHEVRLPADRAIRVLLEELRVEGFEPSADGRPGRILTSLAVRTPDIGLSMNLRPRVALDVVKEGATNLLDVRLEGLEVPLPFGTFDLGRLLPPLRYPAVSTFGVDGSRGEVELRSNLTRITMDRERVRFELELEVVE